MAWLLVLLKLERSGGSLPSPAEPPIVTLAAMGGRSRGRKAGFPFHSRWWTRSCFWFPSPEARRRIATGPRRQTRAGKNPAAWLAHSLPFFRQSEQRASDTSTPGPFRGNDPLKEASGGGEGEKGRLVRRWCVWRYPGGTGEGFRRKRGFPWNPETAWGRTSCTGEAVRLISGAHGFPGRSQGLKSATSNQAGMVPGLGSRGAGRMNAERRRRIEHANRSSRQGF